MTKKRGTSNIPMIMGIIGGVLGIPAALCAGVCAAGFIGFTGDSSMAREAQTIYTTMGIIGAILGLIGGLLGKKLPKIAGIIMILATFMSGITLITGNIFALIVAILFLLGGIFCFVQKKEDVLV